MTEEEIDALARQKLNTCLDRFVAEARELIQYKVHDSINAAEVAVADEKRVAQIALGWVQRLLIEAVAEGLGPETVARFFDNAYYQIASQHCGPEDFSKVARPYKK